jgi:hypothetical protein
MDQEERCYHRELYKSTDDNQTWRIIRSRIYPGHCDHCLLGRGCNKRKDFSRTWKRHRKNKHR